MRVVFLFLFFFWGGVFDLLWGSFCSAFVCYVFFVFFVGGLFVAFVFLTQTHVSFLFEGCVFLLAGGSCFVFGFFFRRGILL